METNAKIIIYKERGKVRSIEIEFLLTRGEDLKGEQ